MTSITAGSIHIGPAYWAVASFAVLLLAVDVLGGFLAYFVLLPAVATCLTAILLAIRSQGRVRAVMATTLVAAAISADVIWVGSLNLG